MRIINGFAYLETVFAKRSTSTPGIFSICPNGTLRESSSKGE